MALLRRKVQRAAAAAGEGLDVRSEVQESLRTADGRTDIPSGQVSVLVMGAGGRVRGVRQALRKASVALAWAEADCVLLLARASTHGVTP